MSKSNNGKKEVGKNPNIEIEKRKNANANLSISASNNNDELKSGIVREYDMV